jgi:hypothetical protein
MNPAEVSAGHPLEYKQDGPKVTMKDRRELQPQELVKQADVAS